MSHSPETLRRWRASIPWNNAQIEIALREEADAQPTEYLRNGYLERADYLAKTGCVTQKSITAVAGRLVKVCAICGASALFRIGYSGRCRTHRLEGAAEYMTRRMAPIEAAGAHLNQQDRELRRRDESASFGRRTRSSHRRSGVERSR